MSKYVGNRIKAARQRKGLSQQELAVQTSVSQPTVANWEKGSHAPRHEALGKIASALGSSPSWLLGDSVNDASPPSLQNQSPHHHIPVLNWPRSEEALNTGAVNYYISASTPATRPIALIVTGEDQAAGQFTDGTVIIFDRADKELLDHSFYLVINDESLVLRRYIAAFNCFLVPGDTDAALPAHEVKILARALMTQQTL